MNKKQKGFAILESLLILVIIAVIGGIGWYAVHTKHQTDKILSQADKISQSTPVSKKTAPTPQNNAQKYLTVKEWGVRVPYAGDDIYSYKDPNGSGSSIEIISKKLADQYGCSDFGAGILAREKGSDTAYPSDDIDGETVSQYSSNHPGTYIVLKNYYYIFSHDQAACSDKVPFAAQNSANQTFGSFVKNLQAIPAS